MMTSKTTYDDIIEKIIWWHHRQHHRQHMTTSLTKLKVKCRRGSNTHSPLAHNWTCWKPWTEMSYRLENYSIEWDVWELVEKILIYRVSQDRFTEAKSGMEKATDQNRRKKSNSTWRSSTKNLEPIFLNPA